MPDPVTIMAILSGTSKGFGAVGAYQAAGQEAAFNSGIAKINRTLALQSADDAIIQGQQKEAIKRVDTAKLVGQQRTGFAASGVVVDSGSAASVVEESIALGELDAQIIRNNAERDAFGFELEAESERLKGKLAKSKGKSLQRAVATDLLADSAEFFG